MATTATTELSLIAGRRLISTNPRATVQEVCEQMVAEGVGAIVVLDEGTLVGIVSERDIVRRVVVKKRDPATTLVSEVMTSPVRTVTEAVSTHASLEIMHKGGFRHLPLVDERGAVIGMLSVRDILRHRIEELDQKNADLMGYLSIDGPGG
jgi:CBS domain-containing protein